MKGRHARLFGITFGLQNQDFGGPGDHFGIFGPNFDGPGLPRTPGGEPLGTKVDFRWIWDAPGVPLGCQVGIIFAIFLCFLVPKVAAGLRTRLLGGFEAGQ